MKKEELMAKGLNQEQTEYVMSEHDKEMNPLRMEMNQYKSQLEDAKKDLEAMKGVDVGGLQVKIQDLTGKLTAKDGEIAQLKADYAFETAVKDAIRKASGRSEKAIMALMDMDTLKGSKNQAADIQKAIEALKKENDYLFQSAAVPRVVSATPGINNDAQTKREQANEALRSLFGKEQR